MKELLRFFLLLVLLIGVFQVSTSVIAQADDVTTDENDDDETETEDEDETDEEDELDDEEIENAYERQVEITQKADKFSVKSELEFGESKDQIEIQFNGGEGPEIELQYQSETQSSEVEFEYRIEIEGLFEYVENGTAEGFQEYEQVSVYEFDEVDWNDLNYDNQIIDGASVWVVTSSTTDGVFKVILYISEGIAQLDNNSTLTPNSLKIDVEIHNFEYTASGSSLALKTKIETETELEVKHEDDTGEEQEGFTTNEAELEFGVGFFSWIETATADGVEINVSASALVDASDDEGEEPEVGKKSGKMYFSFLATDAIDIIWDPKVGVLSQATAENIQNLLNAAGVTDPAGLPGFGIYLALFSLMIGAGIISRRRIKNI